MRTRGSVRQSLVGVHLQIVTPTLHQGLRKCRGKSRTSAIIWRATPLDKEQLSGHCRAFIMAYPTRTERMNQTSSHRRSPWAMSMHTWELILRFLQRPISRSITARARGTIRSGLRSLDAFTSSRYGGTEGRTVRLRSRPSREGVSRKLWRSCSRTTPWAQVSGNRHSAPRE